VGKRAGGLSMAANACGGGWIPDRNDKSFLLLFNGVEK
jgi:hypothetical protein